MMTMNEMRALMESLSAIYTDVRLLDEEAVNAVCEGAYNRRYYEEVARKNAVVCAGTPDQPALPNLVEEAKPQILIVDDSEFNRELLSEILRDDYRILEAADGQIGLEQLSRHRSDIGLILLDINMPVMNGFEVKRRKQRTHPAYPHPHRASAPPPA